MHKKNLFLLLTGNILSHIGTGITMLAIPWLLIKKLNATEAYGYLSILAMVLSILLLPYIGVIVDRFSRKKILLMVAFVGFIGTSLSVQLPENSIYTLAGVYILGQIVYNFQFPTLLAVIQEIFPQEMYERVNGLMEVQSQFAMVAAGGVAGILLDKVSLKTVLIIDASTYLLSIVIFACLQYQKQQTAKKSPHSSVWEGVFYMRKFPQKFLFLFLSLFPFITLVGFNYLLPTHIIRVLDGSAHVFGWGEIVWAFGSITAGISIPILIYKVHMSKMIMLCFFMFMLCIGVHVFNDAVWVFVVNVFFMGWSNASIRVARNTAMMRIVDNEIIGRVNTTIFMFANIIQIILIFTLTTFVDSVGTEYCFFLLLLALLASYYILWRNNYRDV
ncbi:MFS transporter [Candidatus Uabimicrobium sp. HlEnr_7]|uniref:MFS transporter n=1 Tax=Candidatus Uabimicrobium helgolandensis TaxID=3095367 RepID=UPI0035569CE0